jgi:hypothetical protein
MRRQRGVQQLKDNVKSFGGLGEEKLDVLFRNELKLQKKLAEYNSPGDNALKVK